MPIWSIQPITLSLSPKHIEMMVKTHRLNEGDASNPGKIAQVAQQLIDEGLGLPEEAWHAWDDWTKGLE
jgi:hypothetical protein